MAASAPTLHLRGSWNKTQEARKREHDKYRTIVANWMVTWKAILLDRGSTCEETFAGTRKDAESLF